MSIKVLVDTDIGSYIDDAVCLAYLLSHRDCQLLGITTVTDDTKKRAMLASVLCRVAGKKIPIYPGFEKPLKVLQERNEVPQAKILKDWDHDTNFPTTNAVDFLGKSIHDNPRKIVFLTIGPLTNLANLFYRDPEIPSLIKGLVSMCGVFADRFPETDEVEWNVQWDAYATHKVCESAVASHKFVGLDVTRDITMDIKQFLKKMPPEWRKLILALTEASSGPKDTITFHDPLAATTIFDKQICLFKKGLVTVELTGDRIGKTRFSPSIPFAKHEVALEVDKARFFKSYFSAFS